MRSSYFISPKHYSKVCDIAAEAVVQLYTNTNELYYSNVFSYIIDNTIYIKGWVKSEFHIEDNVITQFIAESIEIDMNIVVSLIKKPLPTEVLIDNGTFLGYSNNENIEGIPFEHLEVRKITKLIYDSIDEAVKVQMTINGTEIQMIVETDYTNNSDITDLIKKYIKNTDYFCRTIKFNNIDTDNIFKSGDNFISNTYGPRVVYGNTKFIGLDINSNSKYAHLVSKQIADRYIVDRNLNYSLIELTYQYGNEIPIQKAIKGNNTGINIEYGTFFENEIPQSLILKTKEKIINNIKETPNSLIEMAKWGYFKYK